MSEWLYVYARTFLSRYVDNNRGQGILVWLVVLLVLWLILAGRRVVVQ